METGQNLVPAYDVTSGPLTGIMFGGTKCVLQEKRVFSKKTPLLGLSSRLYDGPLHINWAQQLRAIGLCDSGPPDAAPQGPGTMFLLYPLSEALPIVIKARP